ncbi:VOC family protein [Candidatus Margulisiibacteriota bacterium]
MTQLHHIGLTCSDIKISEKFYIENFGLEKTKEVSVPARLMMEIFGIDSLAKMVYLKAGNSMIELFDFPEAKDLKPAMGNISHMALSVENRKEVFERMKSNGLKTILVDKGEGQFVYFVKDPDGVLIELKD